MTALVGKLHWEIRVREPLLDRLAGRAPAHCWGLAVCSGWGLTLCRQRAPCVSRMQENRGQTGIARLLCMDLRREAFASREHRMRPEAFVCPSSGTVGGGSCASSSCEASRTQSRAGCCGKNGLRDRGARSLRMVRHCHQGQRHRLAAPRQDCPSRALRHGSPGWCRRD